MVLDYINDANQQAFEEFPWLNTSHDHSFETVEGKTEYILSGKENHPIDPDMIQFLRINTPYERALERLRSQEFIRESSSDTHSDPYIWRIKEVTLDEKPLIELYPIPPDGLEIQYVYHERPQMLDNSSDISPIPDRILIWGATAGVLDYDGEDYGKAQMEHQRAIIKARTRNYAGQGFEWGKNATAGLGPDGSTNRLAEPRLPDRFNY